MLQQMLIKPDSKGEIQKTAEATGDLIGNKMVDKITSASKDLRRNYIHKMMKLEMK